MVLNLDERIHFNANILAPQIFDLRIQKLILVQKINLNKFKSQFDMLKEILHIPHNLK